MSIEIIGVAGEAGHGKDTIGKLLVDNYGYTRLAFADPLKDACINIFGLSASQVHDTDEKEKLDEYWLYTPREILQKVGTDLFRNGFSEDIWVKSMDRRIKNLTFAGLTKFVITDVRHHNEHDYIKKMGGTSIKVIRNIINEKKDKHISETEVANIVCDYTIYNNDSLNDLNTEIVNIMKSK